MGTSAEAKFSIDQQFSSHLLAEYLYQFSGVDLSWGKVFKKCSQRIPIAFFLFFFVLHDEKFTEETER